MDDCDLATVRFEVEIVEERACADPGTIDDEIEGRIDILEFAEADIGINRAAGFLKTFGEIIEIDGRVGERDVEGEATRKFVRRGAQRRGYSRKRTRAERVRPIGDLNSVGSRTHTQLDHRHTGLRIF